jgi:hypothetical protein
MLIFVLLRYGPIQKYTAVGSELALLLPWYITRAFLGVPLGPKIHYFCCRLPGILQILFDLEGCPANLIWPSFGNTTVLERLSGCRLSCPLHGGLLKFVHIRGLQPYASNLFYGDLTSKDPLDSGSELHTIGRSDTYASSALFHQARLHCHLVIPCLF